VFFLLRGGFRVNYGRTCIDRRRLFLSDPLCLDSSTVRRALNHFESCSGFDFLGPVCSAPVDPNAYDLLMDCAFTLEGQCTVSGDCYAELVGNVVVDTNTRAFCENGAHMTDLCIASIAFEVVLGRAHLKYTN
jgi:hypothetical protein